MLRMSSSMPAEERNVSLNATSISDAEIFVEDNHSAAVSSSSFDKEEVLAHESQWPNAVKLQDGNLQIEFFEHDHITKKGMAACLINLEDTIRLAEWIPYHYAILPLTSLVIALDPKTSERGIRRTQELIDLWKDKIDITLWPSFLMQEDKRYRKITYIRERQVYFANQCLAYHKNRNRTWTLLTDNDEYFIFNYVHDDETIKNDHPAAEKAMVKTKILHDREKYMPLRRYLPSMVDSTIMDYLDRQDKNTSAVAGSSSNSTETQHFLPACVRVPGIQYGGDSGVNETFVKDFHESFGYDFINPHFLSTLRNIHHRKRSSKFSKVMIDASRVPDDLLEWTPENNAKSIHNPSKVCGYNGKYDSGADYYSSLFRLNHYTGSIEAYLERQGDYRTRSLETYWKKAKKVDVAKAHWDVDLRPWLSVFIKSVGSEEANRLLMPLVTYVMETPQPRGTNDQ